MGLSVQPFIVVVGPSVTQIQKTYVRIDTVMYELSSVAKALDILFKIFITFNTSYPLESENFCYFVQWSVYELYTESDTQIPFVHTLVNKVKKRLN